MVKTILISIILFVLLAIGALVFVRRSQPFRKAATVNVGSAVFNVEIADTFASRAMGLSERKELSENSGMLFVFPFSYKQSFWMKGMNFPLDIIWIDDNKVIGFAENVPTPVGSNSEVYSFPSAADQVLEINSGLVKRLGIKIGDLVTVNK